MVNSLTIRHRFVFCELQRRRLNVRMLGLSSDVIGNRSDYGTIKLDLQCKNNQVCFDFLFLSGAYIAIQWMQMADNDPVECVIVRFFTP